MTLLCKFLTFYWYSPQAPEWPRYSTLSGFEVLSELVSFEMKLTISVKSRDPRSLWVGKIFIFSFLRDSVIFVYLTHKQYRNKGQDSRESYRDSSRRDPLVTPSSPLPHLKRYPPQEAVLYQGRLKHQHSPLPSLLITKGVRITRVWSEDYSLVFTWVV